MCSFFGWDESILLIFYYFKAEGRGEFVMKAVIHISLIVIDTMDHFFSFVFIHMYSSTSTSNVPFAHVENIIQWPRTDISSSC